MVTDWETGVPWLGSVPGTWAVRPLFAVAVPVKSPNAGRRESTILSLSYGRIVTRDVESNFGLLPASFETYNVVQSGQIVMRLTDLQNDQKSLRTGLVERGGAITSAYLTLQFGPGLVPRFAHYLLHSYDTNKVFYSLGAGVRQSMSYSDLRRLPVLIPPLESQHAIADFLDRETARIDDLVVKKQRLIELLEEKQTAMLAKAVLVVAEDAPHPHQPLRSVAEVQVGRQRSPKHAVGPNMTLYLRAANVKAGWLDLGDVMEMNFTPSEQAIFGLRDGDILVTEGAGSLKAVGASAVWRGELEGTVCFQNTLLRLRPRPSIRSDYLAWWAQAAHANGLFASAASGANIFHLSAERVKALPIAVPDLDHQERIVTNLDEAQGRLRKVSQHLNRQLDLLAEYRQALITAAVTGQIDVFGQVPDPEEVVA